MKLLPRGCMGTVSPWGDNYCKAWLMYHGGIFLVGAALLPFGDFGLLIGTALCSSALICGVVNWWIDR